MIIKDKTQINWKQMIFKCSDSVNRGINGNEQGKIFTWYSILIKVGMVPGD